MYCYRCGYLNKKNAVRCDTCNADLTSGPIEPDLTIFADYMQIPLNILTREAMKMGWFWGTILVPLNFVIFHIKRLLRLPWHEKIAVSQRLKLAAVKVEKSGLSRSREFKQTMSFLSERGFETLLDVTDKSVPLKNIIRFMVNRRDNTYVSVRFVKKSSRIENLSFFAIYEDRFLCLENGYGFGAVLPSNIIVINKYGLSLIDLYQTFLAEIGHFPFFQKKAENALPAHSAEPNQPNHPQKGYRAAKGLYRSHHHPLQVAQGYQVSTVPFSREDHRGQGLPNLPKTPLRRLHLSGRRISLLRRMPA